jgi:hypothetical protein
MCWIKRIKDNPTDETALKMGEQVFRIPAEE